MIARVGGVLGFPAAHSLSPAMQNAALRTLGLPHLYLPLEVAPERLAEALQGLHAVGCFGLNVTVPHKEAAAALCMELSPAARRIGAVNTLVPVKNGWRGENTDAPGFLRTLAEAGFDPAGRPCLLLGAGGAARAVAFALAEAGAGMIWIANRSRVRAETLAEAVRTAGGRAEALSLPTGGDPSGGPAADACKRLEEILAECRLLVNATSVGLGGSGDPLPPGIALHPGTLVNDLVYRPLRTAFLARAEAAGCRTLDGLQLLLHQGALALECWLGRTAPLETMRRALQQALNEKTGG